MPQGGEIAVGTGYDPQAGQLILLVKDTGTGIPELDPSQNLRPVFYHQAFGQGNRAGLVDLDRNCACSWRHN